MGYNIGDVSGNATQMADEWVFTADLSDPSVSTISGDWNVVSMRDGSDLGDASDSYAFSALSTRRFGSLDFDTRTGSFVFTIDRDAVFRSGSDQIVSFKITGHGGSESDQDNVFIQLLICMADGTRIETDAGQIAVEALAVGDRVATLDGIPEPIRWIGRRRISSEELAADPAIRPILIRAGALGPGTPARDLRVSPQHRILIADWQNELLFGAFEVLVPAKALVNGDTVLIDNSLRPVEYFHLLLSEHQIIFTEGAPTESFFPGDFAFRELGDAARVELQHRFPQIFEPGGYGETARPTLKRWEGRLVRPERDTAVRKAS